MEESMGNISVHKEQGSRTGLAQHEWEPSRLMRALFGWDPFREMTPYVPEPPNAAFIPAFEVKETKDAFVFKADMPGVKESDLDVTITGTRLSISGKRETEKSENTDTFYAYERSYGSFTRAFTLPEGCDANSVRAELKDGVLHLVLPKKPEVQPKKIAVKTPPPAPPKS
jgi:HSP20 family protein